MMDMYYNGNSEVSRNSTTPSFPLRDSLRASPVCLVTRMDLHGRHAAWSVDESCARARGEYLGTIRPSHAKNMPPLNLLVVDDDAHIRELCHSVALESGMKPTEVSTAEEALEVMEVLPVDILLTDLRLPGTSGLELLKR